MSCPDGHRIDSSAPLCDEICNQARHPIDPSVTLSALTDRWALRKCGQDCGRLGNRFGS